MKRAHSLATLVLLAGTTLAGTAMAQESGNGPADQPDTAATTADTDSPAATGFYTASVDNNGNLVRGENAKSSKRINQGVYEVIFNASVKQCVRVASIGLPNTGDPPPGVISTALRNGNNKGVFIRTGDTSGFSANRPFQLIVICP
jgi:hypothetical protein